jgi:hypothetical protein
MNFRSVFSVEVSIRLEQTRHLTLDAIFRVQVTWYARDANRYVTFVRHFLQHFHILKEVWILGFGGRGIAK